VILGAGPKSRVLVTATVAYLLLGIAAVADLFVREAAVGVSPAAARWLSFAYAYWVAGTLVLLKLCVGGAMLRLPMFARLPLRPLERWLFAFGAGAFLLHAALLLLGLLGGLTLTGVLVLGVLGAVCGYLAFAPPTRMESALVKELLSAPREDQPPWPTWLRRFAALMTAAWLAPHFIQTLLPITDADAWMYHLPLAKRFLTVGLWHVDPYFPAFNFPGVASLFYAAFLLLDAEAAVVPYNFVCGLIILPMVYAIAIRFWSREAAVWAVLLAIACNVVWEVALTPRVDIQLTLYFLLACFAFLLWTATPEQSGYLLLLGMMVGMTLGVKFTAVVIPPLFLLAVAAVVVLTRRLPLAGLLGMVLFMLVPSSFWYARNLATLGDPVYPMLRHRLMYITDAGEMHAFAPLEARFRDRAPTPEAIEAALTAAGTRYFAETQPEEVEQPTHSLNLLTVILAPHWYEMKPFHTVTPYVLLMFCLPFASRDRPATWLFVLGVGFYAVLGSQHWVIRYPLPALMLFPVGAGIVLSQFAARDARRRSMSWRVVLALLTAAVTLTLLRDWRIIFANHPATQGSAALLPVILPFGVLTAIFLVCSTRPTSATTGAARWLLSLTALLVAVNITRDWSCEVMKVIGLRPAAYVWSGQESRWDYIKHAETTGIVNLTEELNQQISSGAINATDTMLMLGEYKGYLLQINYLPDNNFAGYRWRVEIMKAGGDPGILRQRLLDQGMRYILVNDAQIEWFQKGEPRLFNRKGVGFGLHYLNQLLQEKYARVVFGAAGMRILKIE